MLPCSARHRALARPLPTGITERGGADHLWTHQAEAIDAMVTYSRKRKQFGKRICEFQLIEGLIGDAVTNTHAARALCYTLAAFLYILP